MKPLTRWEQRYIAYYVMTHYNLNVGSSFYYTVDPRPRRPMSDMPAHFSTDELRDMAKVIITLGIKGVRADLRNAIKNRLYEKTR